MKIKKLVYVALFAALTAIGAFIRIPTGLAIITLQFVFTAFSALLLGSRLSMLSQGIYIVIGLIGLPVFGAGGGPGYIANPTFGYVLGLLPAAWIIGIMTEKKFSKIRIAVACTYGLFVIYAVGISYMAILLNVVKGQENGFFTLIMSGMIIYLPGDILKIALCVFAAPKLRKALKL